MTPPNGPLESNAQTIHSLVAMAIANHCDLGDQLQTVLISSLTLGQLGGAPLSEARDSAAALLQNAEVLAEQLADLLDLFESLQIAQDNPEEQTHCVA